jgi:NitT/TauT family transport system substrate-binding protein
MVKKVGSLLHLILIAVLFLTSCSGTSASGLETPPLKLEYTLWEGDYTAIIAQEKGFFEKHGVEVELVYYETFSNALPDMAVNRIDIGLFGIGDMLSITRIADVKGIAVYDSGGTVSVVARRNIRNIADLRGKKIGVNIGTTGEMLVREMLSSASMSVSDVELVDVDPETVPGRLSNDDLAAGYVYAPYDAQAIEAGNKALYTLTSTQTLFPDVIVIRGELAKERPEDIRAFLAAWFEAVDYRLANPDECNQIIAKKTGQSVEDLVPDPNFQLFNRDDNLALFSQDVQNANTIYRAAKTNLDFLVMRGNLTLRPDLQTVLDPSFLQ